MHAQRQRFCHAFGGLRQGMAFEGLSMFEWLRNGVASAAIAMGLATASVAHAEEPFRTFVPGVERIEQGPAADGSRPVGQIAPWDETPLDIWVDAELARLEPLITDPKILALAKDDTVYTPQDGSAGFYLVATRTGLIALDDPEQLIPASYLILSGAKKRDPWAAYTLGNMIDVGQIDGHFDIAELAWRRAADLDFQPALINISDLWMSGGTGVDPAVTEAYLRYALDLDASDGGWIVPEQLLNFYIYKVSERNSNGYAGRAVERIRALGDPGLADYFEGLLYSRGVAGVEKDERRGFDLYLKAAVEGATLAYQPIAGTYLGGTGAGVERDLDMVYDYGMACITDTGNYVCYDYIADVALARAATPDAPLVAWAFADYCVQQERGSGCWNATGNPALQAPVSPEEVAFVRDFQQTMLENRFRALPGSAPPRPIDPAALLAARQKE